MDKIKSGDNVVVIFESKEVPLELLAENVKLTTISSSKLADIPKCSADVVITTQFKKEILHQVLDILKPGGSFVIRNHSPEAELNLKVTGFINVSVEKEIVCCKPNYAASATTKITLKNPTTVWKLDNGDDDTIDPDNLLDDEDFKKPTTESLRVCGTTGKRKACKDCSCGLAEELSGEIIAGDVIDTKDAPKSSCGSCYLGDAFRCAACPYLGMPAFKPGEKIQLGGNQLQDDI